MSNEVFRVGQPQLHHRQQAVPARHDPCPRHPAAPAARSRASMLVALAYSIGAGTCTVRLRSVAAVTPVTVDATRPGLGACAERRETTPGSTRRPRNAASSAALGRSGPASCSNQLRTAPRNPAAAKLSTRGAASPPPLCELMGRAKGPRRGTRSRPHKTIVRRQEPLSPSSSSHASSRRYEKGVRRRPAARRAGAGSDARWRRPQHADVGEVLVEGKKTKTDVLRRARTPRLRRGSRVRSRVVSASVSWDWLRATRGSHDAMQTPLDLRLERFRWTER